MDFEDRVAELSTGPLPYRVGGTGPSLLYLHSAGGVRISGPLAALAETYKVHVPTFPGFDGTARHEGIASKQALADLAAEFAEKEIGDVCDVIGHSFGGWVAAWLAVRHPERVDHLVLECPAGFIPEGKGGLPSDPEEMRRRMYAHPERIPADEKPPEIVQANRALLGHYGPAGTLDQALIGELGNIRSMTLVIAGAVDGVIPAESGQLLKARIPRCYLTYVHDAAHNVEIDQPNLFLRLVTDFLKWGDGFLVRRPAEAA